MNSYKHKEIEEKWQKIWEKEKAFKTTNTSNKKCYVLDMFPYPSGAGLHVGHLRGYTATDIISRYKRLKGYDVLHPMGWDAFGLPAEQFALKTGKNPRTFTEKNIHNFKNQIKKIGYSYDWEKEINTTDPKYYEQTQEIFRLLYRNNLAKLEEVPVNWCPKLGTVLANEEILLDENGNKVSERGNFPVYEKYMKQWILKIVNYADKLLEGLKDIEFSDSIKNLQKNWIGKKEGFNIEFIISKNSKKINFSVFLEEEKRKNNACIFANLKNKNVKNIYQKLGFFLNDNEIINEKENIVFRNEIAENEILNLKFNVFFGYTNLDVYNSGFFFLNAKSNEKEIEFLKKYGEINNKNINHDFYELLKSNSEIFNKTKKYKMRNWIFSRQRYWGEPFPIIYKNDQIKLIDEFVELPEMSNIQPTNNGRSPLDNNQIWKKVGEWERETNTMPQWAGSSWYFLAYILKNKDGSYEKLDSPEAKERFKKWLPVDIYVGGQEHATLHLLYARFWHQFLFDIGLVNTKEPFKKLVNQGMILGNDGQKMSKSLGNVINPDEIIDKFGADSLRLYEMFMGPISDTQNWSNEGLKSMNKWLQKVWKIIQKVWSGKIIIDKNYLDLEQIRIWQKTITDVTKLIQKFKFNVAISKFMIFFNHFQKVKKIFSKKIFVEIIIMLSPFAPHICEEILEKLDEKAVKFQTWPTVNERLVNLIPENRVEIVLQVNGRIRDVLILKTKVVDKNFIINEGLKSKKVQKYLAKCKNWKTMFSKNFKLANFVCVEKEEEMEE